MTFAELSSLLHTAVGGDTLLGVYPKFVNQAVRQIETMRSFGCMYLPVQVTIPSGQYFITLPAAFKEPDRGKNPLRSSDPGSPEGFTLWQLLSKQEVKRLTLIGVNTSERKAYIGPGDVTGTLKALYISGPASADINFTLDAYQFFDDLADPTDENWFTTNYPMMVLEKAKELCFALSNNADATGFAYGRFTEEFSRASRDDNSRKVAGRNFRMGGY